MEREEGLLRQIEEVIERARHSIRAGDGKYVKHLGEMYKMATEPWIYRRLGIRPVRTEKI